MDSFLTAGGILSCVLGGIFHVTCSQKNRTATYLENRVVALDGGRQGIQGIVDLLPLMVALTGTVYCTKPLSCSLSDKHCAIVERVEEKKVESLVNNVWVSGFETLSVDRKEEAFGVLVDDVNKENRVLLPIVHRRGTIAERGGRRDGQGVQVEGTYLITSGETFEPASNQYSLVHHVVGHVSGHRDVGTRTTERCLPVGAVVTAIGELAWDTVQRDETFQDSDEVALLRSPKEAKALVLRPPSGTDKNRHHFMLWEGASFSTVIELYRGAASFAGTASVYCYVVGACMLGTTLFRRFHKKYRERLFRKQFQEALRDRRRQRAPRHAGTHGDESLDGADRMLEDESKRPVCVVCLDGPCAKAYPCGHLCICTSCSSRGSAAIKCPICRTHGKPMTIYSV